MGGRLPSRPMTFTGCWTCKARKIRCDETPVSCRNCEKKGVACGGYGIRLQWVSDPFTQPDKQAGGTGGRRSIKLDKLSGQRYRLDDIDGFLGVIDGEAVSRESVRHGPFSVFPIQPSDVGGSSKEDNPVSLAIPPDPLNPHDSGAQTRQEWDYEDYAVDLNENHSSYLPVTVPIAQSEEGRVIDQGQVGQEDTLTITSDELDGVLDPYLNSSTPDISQDQNFGSELVVFQNTSHNETSFGSPVRTLAQDFLRHPALPRNPRITLSGDVEIDSLIDHYMIHVADILQPLLHPQNQYRSRGLFLTSALQGAIKNILDPTECTPTIYSTLFHSVLASAAYHLWNRNKYYARYKSLGVAHQQNALSSLRVAMQSPASGADYKTLMMAMLSLVTIGVVSGDGADFQVHLGAANQLRNSRNRWRVVSSQTRQVNEISFFLSLLTRTLAFQPSSTTWSGREQQTLDEEMDLVQSNTCFEFMYGITPVIAGTILEMCRLGEYLLRFQQDGGNSSSIPDDLLEACESLGEKLLSWRFDLETISSIQANDVYISTIFYHQAHAWHHAALVYYYRRIQSWKSADLTQEIQHTMEHMHAAEDSKMMPGSPRQGLMAPLTWPATIASLDAIGAQRDICRRWWERVLSYGLANIDKQWDVVQQVWERVDELRQCHGVGAPDGMTVYRSLDIHILPV
ncbi:unnamed protein product [Clonostachys rosea f. rosea IK726]|uniref:Uncharacterized protein n=1 Tax=Clonostachys rosea f. rosea IK726 TaxID=1349383 RepID=A0ACA9TLE5_BIOOC|nr:unnamed protein product [Clonostachys rosea f. rosea IK726]